MEKFEVLTAPRRLVELIQLIQVCLEELTFYPQDLFLTYIHSYLNSTRSIFICHINFDTLSISFTRNRMMIIKYKYFE